MIQLPDIKIDQIEFCNLCDDPLDYTDQDGEILHRLYYGQFGDFIRISYHKGCYQTISRLEWPTQL